MGIVAIIGIIAAGITLGFVTVQVIRFVVSALVKLVKKLRERGAKKTLAADINAMAEMCTNKKSFAELEKLQEDGVTHVVAGIDENGNIVDKVNLIKDTEEETAYEIVDLLGDEGVVVIED